MYAITGITGQVGGVVATALLNQGKQVRAVMRDRTKTGPWGQKGCEIALADMSDATALTAAFADVEAVFIVIPPLFDPAPGFPEVRAVIAALKTAISAARPPKIVCLSTVGAQASQPSLLSQLGLVEQEFGALDVPITFLRAAWFMENALWDVATARETGVIRSFLQPLDKPVPMVAVRDIGLLAAELLQETWQGRRVVELEGPRPVTPNEIAACFAEILGRPVRGEIVPRDSWEELFRSQGARNPGPRARMLDGFNEGWIAFEGGPRHGATPIGAVLRQLVARG
jgi:NAD(P)H dehydrogenase (quinone)